MDKTKEKKYGFLGLGAMGFPICYNLVKSGYTIYLPEWRKDTMTLHGFSPLVENGEQKREKFNQMVNNGAILAKSQREMLESIDVLLLILPKSLQVEDVILGKDGVAEVCKKGTLVIDMTSADYQSTKKLSAILSKKGIDMIDCPVSGGPKGATNQTLAVMVGGKRELFEEYRPLFETIGKKEKLEYIGPIGSAHLLKSTNNFLTATSCVATSEAMCVLANAGIDLNLAAKVISNSSGSNNSTQVKFPEIVFPGNNWNFIVDLMMKDINLFIKAAEGFGVPTNVSSKIIEILKKETELSGTTKDDLTSIPRMYENWSSTKIYGIKNK